jgi:multidrug efflux pump subunit AcrA (membrane-fusion protein)
VILLLLAALGLAGCGSVKTAAIPPSFRLVHVPGSPAGKIILSATGAQRIGLQTALAGINAKSVTVPYSAVIYTPSGQTYVFSNPARLTYSEVRITVHRISGNVVFLTRGPPPGTRVVTVGAEELYGVQTGVLAQT